MSVAAAIESCPIPSPRARQHLRRRSMGRPKKYHTEEELREASRQASLKYYNTHRDAINARRAKATKRKRAAMKAVRKET
jgi:hypothetical protein